MNIGQYLADATAKLSVEGIVTARLDTLVLLEDCLNKDRALLLAHPETVLSLEQITQLDEQIQRRMNHEPLAYIRGRSEFYGRVFNVDNNVLEPRPESELMIDMLKKLLGGDKSGYGPRSHSVVDVGTGSGALAITAKLELPNIRVIAIDIDPKCLAVVRSNADMHQADIELLEGNLIEPLAASGIAPTVLLCNLPYVPDEFDINQAARHEPRLAIFGGPDGLDIYRKLFGQLHDSDPSIKPKYILAESLPPQHTDLGVIAENAGYTTEQDEEFMQLFTLAK